MEQPPITPFQYRLGLGFLGFLIVSGGALMLFGLSFLKTATASQQWPTAQGKVQAVTVTRDRTSTSSSPTYTYAYTVTYRYEVNSNPYRGDRYSLGNGSTASKRYPERSEATAAAAKNYRIGQSVEVYYNPADPTSAVLKPGANISTFVPLILGLFFIASGVSIVILMRHNAARG